LLGLAGAAALMAGSKPVAFAGIVAAGLGFANIWPMLFSITVEERPERANELSGLMCMAISGGAIVPLVMGLLRDWEWGATAFIVPTACFGYLFLLSLRRGRKPAPVPPAPVP
jgi:fucose permease